ncbi:MAG: barstar family protein [Burkholderiaceae bacterium]
MSALSNIPAQAVLPLSAYNLSDLRRAAERADQRFLHADLHTCADKAQVLAAIAEAFALPAHFGHNLDALFDCVTDLKPPSRADRPGFVIVLEGLPDAQAFNAQARNALLDVFRDAADFFDDRGCAFRVFYSVNRPVAASLAH